MKKSTGQVVSTPQDESVIIDFRGTHPEVPFYGQERPRKKGWETPGNPAYEDAKRAQEKAAQGVTRQSAPPPPPPGSPGPSGEIRRQDPRTATSAMAKPIATPKTAHEIRIEGKSAAMKSAMAEYEKAHTHLLEVRANPKSTTMDKLKADLEHAEAENRVLRLNRDPESPLPEE